MTKTLHLFIPRILIFFALIAGFAAGARADDRVYELDRLAPGDPIAALLDQAGLTPDDLQLDVSELSRRLITSATMRPPGLFYTFVAEPLRISWYLLHYRSRIFHAKEYLRKVVMYMTARINVSVYRGYHSNPWREIEQALEREPEPMLYWLERIADFYDDPLTPKSRADIRARLKELPPEFHKPVATLLAFSHSAVEFHHKAFEDWKNSPHKKDEFFTLMESQLFRPNGRSIDWREAVQRVDYAYLCAGAEDVAEGIDRAWPDLADADPATTESELWQMNTPLGLILINWGEQNNTYRVPASQNVFLMIDYAGDDTYINGAANESTTQPVSLLFDFAGNDNYIAPDQWRPSFGAGIAGYGVLIDAAGDDNYNAGQYSQGAAFLGMGALWDKAGNDSYKGVQNCQGAAIGGLALLYDTSGSDSYHAFTKTQGYGGTRGFGFLMDDHGDDRYVCDDERLFSPAAQAPDHNSSLGQGAGHGVRADLSDGHSVPGGVGMLLDEEGDDTYSAGVMAQGVGFWQGVGVLMDMKGNDRYDGVYYAQGVGIHSAVGALCDYDGNDTYTAHLYIAQGSGHDFSVGYLLDERGDDLYISPPLAPGTANQNAIGIFLERAGNDEYRSSDRVSAYGHARMSKWGTPGEDLLNVGLFLDLGGQDRYRRDGREMTNDRFWIQEPQYRHDPRLESQWGMGVDGDFPSIDTPLHPITPYTPDD